MTCDPTTIWSQPGDKKASVGARTGDSYSKCDLTPRIEKIVNGSLLARTCERSQSAIVSSHNLRIRACVSLRPREAASTSAAPHLLIPPHSVHPDFKKPGSKLQQRGTGTH